VIRARCALVLGALGLSCAGSPLRGGYARRETPIYGGKLLASFIPGHCEDAAHVELLPRFSSVELLETETGRTLLLEHRQGHDLLVVENFHDEGSSWVFELVVKGDHLRRWRIPRSPSGTGTLFAGRELTEHAHRERFEAGLASSHLECSLVPKASDLPVSSSRATGSGTLATSEPHASSAPPGLLR
jgi:hypothetical protein